MNPNEDIAFEARLQKLAQATQRPDPTAGWKAEILERALESACIDSKPRFLPPRWFMMGLAASWVFIGGLTFLTPAGLSNPPLAVKGKEPINPPQVIPLVAFERHFKLYADLP